MSTAYIHLIQHQLTKKSLMISVGTATETVLVKKKDKVLSSLNRIGIKREYPAYYKWRLHGAETSRSQTCRTSCWSGWPREFGTLNSNPHSEYSPRYFSYFSLRSQHLLHPYIHNLYLNTIIFKAIKAFGVVCLRIKLT